MYLFHRIPTYKSLELQFYSRDSRPNMVKCWFSRGKSDELWKIRGCKSSVLDCWNGCKLNYKIESIFWCIKESIHVLWDNFWFLLFLFRWDRTYLRTYHHLEVDVQQIPKIALNQPNLISSLSPKPPKFFSKITFLENLKYALKFKKSSFLRFYKYSDGFYRNLYALIDHFIHNLQWMTMLARNSLFTVFTVLSIALIWRSKFISSVLTCMNIWTLMLFNGLFHYWHCFDLSCITSGLIYKGHGLGTATV